MKDSRVLLLRRAIEPSKGEWDVVGGFLNPGESAEDCLAREAYEEIGIKVKVDRCVGTFPSVYGSTGLTTIGLAFTCSALGEEIKLSSENSEYAWFDLDQLPPVAFADVANALEVLRLER